MQPSTTPDDPRIGSLIADRYRVERLIGRGGMASVYEAADTALGRTVALKIFRPELADDDDLRRHDGEVKILAGLNHPGLVTLFDAVADERGAAVLVLELVTGTDLRTTMDAHTLPRRDIALIGAIVGEALAYSHDRGIIHRDIKPANILVPSVDTGHTGSRAKLADFGIARLVDDTRVTAIGSIIGTAQYLSPEQALGGEVGPSSDVYSLGLVIIEALGGGRPFPGTGVESVAARLASDPVLPDGLSASWTALLRGMTEREPAARLSAAAAAQSLRQLVAHDDDSLAATAVMPAHLFAGSSAPTAATEVLGGQPAATEVLGGLPAATEVLGGQPAADEATVAMTATVSPSPHAPAPSARITPQQSPHGTASSPKSLRRNTVIASVVGAGIVLAGAVALGLAFTATTAPANQTPSPAYPAVDGPVGDHLEQLQRSVQP